MREELPGDKYIRFGQQLQTLSCSCFLIPVLIVIILVVLIVVYSMVAAMFR